MSEKKDTISEALGITPDWEKENCDKLTETLIAEKYISDGILNHIINLKTDEFGKGDYEVSSYEKKLIWTGMEIAKILIANSQAKMIESGLASLLLKGLTGGGPLFPPKDKDE